MQNNEAKASVTFVRISSSKVKIVIDLVRGKKVDEALAILKHTPKAASEPVLKLLKSAIANATHNYNLDEDKLFIKEIYVGQGPTMKRIQPRAKGAAYPILKRTSHIYIVVAEAAE
ncbi:MAG: 50S ribosomal protein L22 [Clostridiales bacterium]|nr:50S ribosomal protein L22 [Clostridiales bacterium]